jgi:hypothetical protein
MCSQEDLEEIFDQHFKDRQWEYDRGRLAVASFESEHFGAFQPQVLSQIRTIINSRLKRYGKEIKPPQGPATIHLDFIDSAESNAQTFVEDGKYFIGIGSPMLLDFKRACEALTEREALTALLELKPDASTLKAQALATAIFVLQIQFVVFHELGHIFHNHRGARSFRKEYVPSPEEKILLLWPDRNGEHVSEMLADRYAVRMLLQDMISTETGANIYKGVGSALDPDECFLLLLILSIGASFFFGPSERFHPPLLRKRNHPSDLARMNIVMRSILEWADEQKREDIKQWASDYNFKWVTACIQDAAQSEDRRQDWIEQGEYFKADEGRYLDLLYQNDIVTPEMMKDWWKV